MNSLVKYSPTLWSMRKFIKNSLLLSLVINIIIYISYKNIFLYLVLMIFAIVSFFYIMESSDKEKNYTIEDYDIFDKQNINAFQEYAIILLIFSTFFILIVYSITDSYTNMNYSSNLKLLHTPECNTTILNFDYNKKMQKIIYSHNKDEHNLTTCELNYLKKLKISFNDSGKTLGIMKQTYLLTKNLSKYLISFFIIIIPLLFIIDSSNKPQYHIKSLIISFSIFLGILLFYEHIPKNIDLYFQKILFFAKSHKYILLFIATWLIINSYFIYSNQTKSWAWDSLKINISGGFGSSIISIILFFFLFNFCFNLNIFLSTFLMIILSFIIIYPLKQLSLMNELKAKE